MELDIFSLFEADKKSEIKNICSNLELDFVDLYDLVKLSEAKIIESPYLHVCKLFEQTPDDIKLTEKIFQQ